VGIGISAMITVLPIKREVFAKDLLFLFMGPLLILVFIAVSARNALTLVHGLFLFVGFAGYLFWTNREMIRHNRKLPKSDQACMDASCKREWGIFFLGGVMLYVGGEIIFRNALTIVERLQISESIVGLTVIAVGTSIPDCAASIIAVFKKQKDIAIGNILGSNIFNIFLVLAVTIVAFKEPIFFSQGNLFDYLSVCILSLLFFIVVITRQSYGPVMGFLTLAYYPLSLLVRILCFG
jgi:cation:H+ antiporter